MQIKWDKWHSLILAGSTMGGAIVGYLEAQPPASLIAALGAWTTAKPVVFGAIYAALAALLALAKQTFLVAPPSPPTPSTPTRVDPTIKTPTIAFKSEAPKPLTGTTPTTRRAAIGLAAVVATALATAPLAGVGAVAMSEEACTPAEQATLQQVENVVLNDLTAGKPLAQIEADVGQVLAGQTGVDIAGIVNAALTLLIDTGIIPSNWIPTALTFRDASAKESAAFKAAHSDGGV